MKRRWVVYVLRCEDGSLYTGITDDLDARLAAHASGKGACYTRSRRPVALAWCKRGQTATDARRLEPRVKRLERAEKERLVAGDVRAWRRLRGTLVEDRRR